MRKSVIICLAVTAMTALKAEAFDWTVLSKLFTPAAATTAETVQTNAKDEAIAALNDIQKQTNEIDKSVQDNFASIITMISAKKEAKSIKSELNSILSSAEKTDSEKESLYNQALNTYLTSLSNNSSTTSTLKKLSSSSKIQLVKNITNLEQASKKYTELSKQALKTSASSLVKTTSSNATTDDIAEVISKTNQTIGLIKTKAANTLELANQLREIAKKAGVVK